jgi:hypothetical protein
VSLLEKQPGRTARARVRPLPAVQEPATPETRDIISNALSRCLYCRGAVPVMVTDAGVHVTKDGKQFACADRPVARPGGW